MTETSLLREPLIARTWPTPRLLVSVRDVQEFLAAWHGGAAIIDFKEPAHGALGMVSQAVFDQIEGLLNALDDSKSVPILSAALGEAIDWESANVQAGEERVIRIPDSITFLKLGFAEFANDARWPEHWMRLRNTIEVRHQRRFSWVAVIYADFLNANAPHPDEILRAARETGCAGVLVDTFQKSSGTLLNHFSVEELSRMAKSAQEAGQLFALAGRVSRADLPILRTISAEIIGIRSAACENGERNRAVSERAVREFLRDLAEL